MATPKPRTIDYSHTAVSTFKFCQKKYYFSWLMKRKQGWRKTHDHPWYRVFILKQLQNPAAWRGHLYHQIIAHALRNDRKIYEDEVVELACGLAETQFNYSQQRQYWGATKSKVPEYVGNSIYLALFPHEYNQPDQNLLEETQGKITQWLRNTFDWSGWGELISYIPRNPIHIEPHYLSYIFGGARINARMDLGIDLQRQQKFLVYDWKCYSENRNFVDYNQSQFKRQLLSYAIWPIVSEEKMLPINNVSAHVFNPITNQEQVISFTEDDIADFELFVQRWVHIQTQYFTEVNEVIFEDLTGPRNPGQSCPYCAYQAVCGEDIAWHTLT